MSERVKIALGTIEFVSFVAGFGSGSGYKMFTDTGTNTASARQDQITNYQNEIGMDRATIYKLKGYPDATAVLQTEIKHDQDKIASIQAANAAAHYDGENLVFAESLGLGVGLGLAAAGLAYAVKYSVIRLRGRQSRANPMSA